MISLAVQNIWIILAIGLNLLVLIQNPKRMDISTTIEEREKATWFLIILFMLTYTTITA